MPISFPSSASGRLPCFTPLSAFIIISIARSPTGPKASPSSPHAADHSGVDGAGELFWHRDGPLGDSWHESSGEVPDYGLAHVSGRVFPRLDRSPALDPAAHSFYRFRHLALAPHRVRDLCGVGDGRPRLCLAAGLRA